jgi:hypothetical protein
MQGRRAEGAWTAAAALQQPRGIVYGYQLAAGCEVSVLRQHVHWFPHAPGCNAQLFNQLPEQSSRPTAAAQITAVTQSYSIILWV